MPKCIKSFKNKALARKYRNAQRKMNYGKGRKSDKNRGQEWTIEDMNLLTNSGKTDRELSVAIGRSVQAIQVKRSHLEMQ